VALLQICTMSWGPAAGLPPCLPPGKNALKNLCPKLQNQPLLKRNVQTNFWPAKLNSNCFSPPHGIAWPPGLLKGGPVGSAADEWGKMLYEAPVSTRKRRPEMSSVIWKSLREPQRRGLRPEGLQLHCLPRNVVLLAFFPLCHGCGVLVEGSLV